MRTLGARLVAPALVVALAVVLAGCAAQEAARRAEVATSTTAVTTTAAAAATEATRAPITDRALDGYAVAGDSVALSLLPSLRAAFARVDPRAPDPQVSILAALGFGFGGDAPGWRADGARAPDPATWVDWTDRARVVLAARRPAVVVVLAGTWDAIVREIHGVRTAPGDPGWRAWYERRVRDAADVYASVGSRIVWLLPACTGDGGRDRWLDAVRGSMRAALRGRRDVEVVDLSPLACPHGVPRHELPTPGGRLPLLEPDAVHFAHERAVPAAAPWLAARLRLALGTVGPG